MRFLYIPLALILSFSSALYALDTPTGRTILTVTGAIKTTNSDQGAIFDMAMLNALPRHSVATHNLWTEGLNTYEGFAAADLLKLLGNKGNVLQVTALNDYMTEIPVSDFIEQGAIFATHQNGKRMSVRNLGPMMVIYPFDSNENVRSDIYYSRSIWQIKHIKSIITTE
ncbi:hypothetical protein OFY17_04135 [Marinomonas sp. C2222]|uniref:Oxidoreductase molybdopterin binding domain protein n=1 Tax=Marinomonas sargassi TaxID=2984494 RepID=A0ABT2YQB3_9GAMM|nr:hypothetical protein [Marinomonas sargassi]MCV2402072.1 hypothetical protein [Marinomonas sargassi]